MSKYEVISRPYFPAFGLNTEKSVFGHFSRTVSDIKGMIEKCLKFDVESKLMPGFVYTTRLLLEVLERF